MNVLPADHPAFSEEVANRIAKETIEEYLEQENTILSLQNIRIRKVPEIPTTVRSLILNSTKIEEIPCLPNLISLSARVTPLKKIIQLPETLHHLYVSNTPIEELPALPKRLRNLHCNSTKIRFLPALPNTLEELWVNNTKLEELPDLPPNLETLWVYNTFLEELPPLPDSLLFLQTHTTHLIQRQPGEAMSSYIRRANQFYEQKRIHKRNSLIKEELMAVVWNPDRVSKWLEGMDETSFNTMIGDEY